MMKGNLFISVLFACLLTVFAVINPTQQQLDANDNNVLAYALTLENLEATFYAQFQAQYSRQNFIDAGYASGVYDNFVLLASQEAAHVTILQGVLQSRGVTQQYPACNYNFSAVQSVANYVAVARLLENVGTGAYDGSINSIYNRALQQAAATIATVEGRHAAFLNQLPGTSSVPSFVPNALSPFPNATDYAFSNLTVAGFVAPFIVNCSYNVTAILPTVYMVIPVAAPNSSYTANPSQYQVNANDVVALNYALSLELLEATFYNRYLAQFSQNDFINAGFNASVYMYIQMIAAHENAHVTFLTNAVTARGGTPAPNCTYNFAAVVTSVSTFIGVARILENTGVTAYDGAVNTIFDTGLRVAAATVATVEARHAAYLNQLNGMMPFPNTTDNATLPVDIINIIQQFITSCPSPVIPPQSLVVIPYSNGTSTPTSATSGSSTSGTSTGTSTGTGSSTGTSTTSSAPFTAVISLFALFSALLLSLF